MTATDETPNQLEAGFIGLGDMGAPMANNLSTNDSGTGLNLTVFDIQLKTENVPATARVANSLADIANCDVVFMSVPDGASSMTVVQGLLAQPQSRVKTVINLSTIGLMACEEILQAIPDGAFDYIDAPVSGGKSGAINGTVTVIWSGRRKTFDALQPVMSSFAGSVFFVGDKPGQGQAVKLLNNYLSGVALTATSEALRFGLHHGIDMKTILDVVHVSTGQNKAISDKFPKRVLTGTYDAGFRMALMQKDIELYQQGVTAAGLPSTIADVVSAYWNLGADTFPDGDFTEIFKVIDSNPAESD